MARLEQNEGNCQGKKSNLPAMALVFRIKNCLVIQGTIFRNHSIDPSNIYDVMLARA